MTTLAHLVHRHFQSIPEQPSIIRQHAGHEDKTISYRALVEGSYRYARTYAPEGIQPGKVYRLLCG